MFRASSSLLVEGKGQEEEGMWLDKLSGFSCLSHSVWETMVRNYGLGSSAVKREWVDQCDAKSWKARLGT